MSQLTQTLPGYLRTDSDDRVDAFEASLLDYESVDCPLLERFIPGMYIRERFVPSGTTISSRIHRTEHPYVILAGRGEVWSPETGIVLYEAPYTGVTKPGTRRALKAYEDTVWITFHSTDETDLEKLDELLFYPLENHPSLHVH